MTTATESVSSWLSDFEAAVGRGRHRPRGGDVRRRVLLARSVSFTWNLKTLEGRQEIADMLRSQLADVAPHGFVLAGEANEADGITDGWFDFETAVARGHGHIRLRGNECWTLLTTMVELKGHEEQRLSARPKGVEHGVVRGRQSWLERKQAAEVARLRRAAVLRHYWRRTGRHRPGGTAQTAWTCRRSSSKRTSRPGDSWRKRYKSLCLHDPVWYDHLPYLPFPDHWPVFSPKDKIADWLEMYTKVMELNYWHSTECRSAQYHEDTHDWTVDGRP